MATAVQPDTATQGESTSVVCGSSRMMVVAIVDISGTRKLMWLAQTGPNGLWDTTLTPVNDNAYETMDAGSTQDGRVAIVAHSTTQGEIQFIDEALDIVDVEKWNAPVSLGMPSAKGPILGLSMCRSADGRVEIFATDEQGHLWWIFQNPDQIVDKKITVEIDGKPVEVTVQESAPPAQPWSSWQQIAPLSGNGFGKLLTCNTADGRVALVAQFSSAKPGSILATSRESKPVALTPADWTQWVELQSDVTIALGSAVLDELGAINVCGRNETDVVRIKENPPGSNIWGVWSSIGISGQVADVVTAGAMANENLCVIAVDQNGNVHSRLQTSVISEQWTGWDLIKQKTGVNGTKSLSMGWNADGRLTFFISSKNEPFLLASVSQMTANSTEWKMDWQVLIDGCLSEYAVVQDLTPTGVAPLFIRHDTILDLGSFSKQ